MASVRKLLKQLGTIVESADDSKLSFPLVVLDHGSRPLRAPDALKKMDEIEKGWKEGETSSDKSHYGDTIKLTDFTMKDGSRIERELHVSPELTVKYIAYAMRRRQATGFARGM